MCVYTVRRLVAVEAAGGAGLARNVWRRCPGQMVGKRAGGLAGDPGWCREAHSREQVERSVIMAGSGGLEGLLGAGGVEERRERSGLV